MTKNTTTAETIRLLKRSSLQDVIDELNLNAPNDATQFNRILKKHHWEFNEYFSVLRVNNECT